MLFCFFKQKPAYEMRISDWSSVLCSSDLAAQHPGHSVAGGAGRRAARPSRHVGLPDRRPRPVRQGPRHGRSAPPPGSLRIAARLRTGATQAARPVDHRVSSASVPAPPSLGRLDLPTRATAMSRLRIFADNTPDTPEFSSSDGDAIARELDKIGVTFERWQAAQPIAPGASPGEVMEAYRADIDRLVAERGFKSVEIGRAHV